jgi:hypothetical protein
MFENAMKTENKIPIPNSLGLPHACPHKFGYRLMNHNLLWRLKLRKSMVGREMVGIQHRIEKQCISNH